MTAMVYGLMRLLAATMTRWAAWRHGRAKLNLELADAKFEQLELDCKADEVQSGRAASLASQFKMLRAFEDREAMNQRWQKAALRLRRRRRMQNRIAAFSGLKLPYTFGLIDMALVFKGLEMAYTNSWTWDSVSHLIGQLI